MNRKTQINLWYTVAAVLAIVFIQQWWAERQRVETIPYSQFEALVRDVFVFGSDLAGRHASGDALRALRQYGAVYGRA